MFLLLSFSFFNKKKTVDMTFLSNVLNLGYEGLHTNIKRKA